MSIISKRIINMKESQTILMAKKSRELKKSGVDIIDLSLGEPDFATPKYICDAAKKALDDGYTHYPPVAGYADLREAISDKFDKENGLKYHPDQIVVSTGAKQTLANAFLSLVNPGEEVLVPIPYWVSYMAQIHLCRGNAVMVPSSIESDFKIDPSTLKNYITPKTRAIIFSSPCNPSGSVYSVAELTEIAKALEPYENISILSDEIYEYINFTSRHESIGSLELLKDRVITINGMSKGYAMTGWRLGYLGAPLNVAKAVAKMQGQFTSGANAVTQRAALAAINGNRSEVYKMKEAFLTRRNLMIGWLKEIEGMKINIPEGAFYLFPKISSFFGMANGKWQINNADDLCLYLIEEANVSVVTGSAFGAPDYLRLSYANSEENLKKAAERMKEYLSKLR